MAIRRRRLVLLVGTGLWLLLVVVFAAALLWPRGSSNGAPAEVYALGDSQRDGELPVLWPAPEFSFASHTGETVTPATLKGKVWIADFIFTTCKTVCPLITARMTALQRRLPDSGLHFVSFSVDPENDTVDALAQYARTWNPEERRWTLLATDPSGLDAVARGMRVAVSPTDDPENPIMHTNLFMLVDQDGQVRGVYNSSDKVAVQRLERDARMLLGNTALTDAPVSKRSGADLYATLRCAACHDDAKIAPPLGGLMGRTVKLEGGGEVAADEAYLKRAILQPGVEVVAGYLPLMPAYGDEFAPGELDALVTHLASLEASGASEQTAELAIDPICNMQVRATPDALHVTHDGKTTWFCSQMCKDRFEQSLRDR